MRKNRLIALIGTLTMAAAGLAAVSAGVSSKKADSVSAATSTTLYCAISPNSLKNLTLKYNAHLGSNDSDPWASGVMTAVNKTYHGKPVYKATFTDSWDGLHKIQFQVYNGSTWVEQVETFSTWTQPSVYNNKLWVYGESEWRTVEYDDWYLRGKFDGVDQWGSENPFTFDSYKGSDKYSQYKINNFCLSAGDTFKFYDALTETWLGDGQITLDNLSDYFESDGDGNFKVKADKNVKANVYLKVCDTTRSVYFSEQKSTLTISSNDTNMGTATASKTSDISYKENVTLTATAKTGYHFVQWSDSDTNASRSISVTDSASYTATFAPNTNTAYTVKHYKEDLTGGTYTLADTDNLTGTTGANTAASAKSYEGFTAPSITQQPIAADGSTVLNLNYTRNSHTLSWVTDGDPLTGDYTSGSVKYGTTIVAPNTPTKANDYVFNGWSPSVPETMPDNNVELTATWVKSTKPTYTVTIAVNDASRGTVSSSSVVVEEGTTYSTSENTLSFATNPVTNVTATANDPTGAYTYAFTGWSSNSGTINAATTITANFSATDNKYSISWSAPSDVSVTYNSPAGDDYLYHAQILEPTINSMTGYDFDGWYYTDSTHSSETKITSWPFQLESDTSIVGKFTKQTFSVAVEIYKGEDEYGTISGNSFTNVPYGSPVTVDGNKLSINGQTITATPNDGGDACTYAFTGWVDYPATITGGGQHIKATFSKTMKTYTLDWNFNGGSTEQTAGVDYTAADTYDYGTPITAPTLTKEGYTFSSWSPDFSSTLTGNVTYTAQWVRENGYYIHVFGDNERYIKMSSHGTTEYVGTVDLDKGETFKITTITGGSEGLWSGWSAVKYDTGDGPHVDARSTAQVVDDGTNDHNIKANLAGTNTYKVFYDTTESLIDNVGGYHTYIPSIVNVDFDLNGKTGTAPDSQVVYARDLVSEPEDPTTTESYEFEGWYSEAACTNKWDFDTFQVVYFSVDSTTHVATQKIYANWISTATYDITLDDNGGSGGEGTIENVKEGDEISVTALPEKEKYSFQGYFTATTGGTKVIDSDGSNETPYSSSFGETLYAQWDLDRGTYLTGSFGDADWARDGKYVMTLNPGTENQYVIKGVELEANDELRPYFDTGDYDWGEIGSITWSHPNYKGEKSGNNCKVLTAGTYDIYYDTVTHELHLAMPTMPENGRYFVLNEGAGQQLILAEEHPGWSGTEYKASFVCNKGDKIKAYFQDSTQATIYPLEMNESVKTWEKDENNNLVCPEYGSYSFYMISKDGGQNYNYVSIFKEGEAEAVEFAKKFNAAMAGVCDKDGKTEESKLQSAWETIAGTYATDLATKAAAKSLLADNNLKTCANEDLVKFAEGYDYIYKKYGVALGEYGGDFADRKVTPQSSSRNLISIKNVSTSTWIIASVAIVGIAAVGVFFIYRKRKEN